jgi:aryl-alcohol dehydrogenase-like predicted oxidoreductase
MAIIARVPLASGLLTGKMTKDSFFPANDHRNYNIKGEAFDVGETFSGVSFEKGLEAVEELKKLLPENFTLADFALKWILMHDEVTVAIPGAKNKQQASLNVNSIDLDEISELMPSIKNIYDKYFREDIHHRW